MLISFICHFQNELFLGFLDNRQSLFPGTFYVFFSIYYIGLLREGNSERNYCPPAFKLSLLREKQPKSIIQTSVCEREACLSVAVLQSISAVRQAKTGNKKGHKCIYVFISVRLCVRSSPYLKEKPRGI